MIGALIRKIQKLGVERETGYVNKKDLVGFNSTFLWTNVLIFLNIFIAWSQHLNYIALVNVCGNVCFLAILYLNHKGHFHVVRHIGIICANVYVYFMSIVGGPELQFQYAYTIILTVIGIVFSQRNYLLIHLPLCVVFFIAVKISYYYIPPIQYIPENETDYFAFNNGLIFMALVSAVAFAFRNQTNYYIRDIEQKKNLIEEKQKEIFDSINYARRIQSAILANSSVLDTHLKKENHFIFFRPKDIVSGDFYWAVAVHSRYRISDGLFAANKFDELFYLAICDSTGHGVPGAFMSLLNMGFLSEAISERRIYEPHKIFDFVRAKLIESISSEEHKDGFDGILVCFNKTSGQITYAAANNTPLLVTSNEMRHLPADKMPVGKGVKTEHFSLYELPAHAGDLIYLYTDGYPDQFGGPRGKKFKYRQLEEMLLNSADLPMQEQHELLNKKFEAWKGALEQVDDVCMIGIRL